MTDTRTNGELSDVQMEALSFTFADHLRVKGERDDALEDNAELRIQLAERDAKLKAMFEHCAFLEDRLNIATSDRTRAIDERAEYAVKLDMLRKLLDPVQDAIP